MYFFVISPINAILQFPEPSLAFGKTCNLLCFIILQRPHHYPILFQFSQPHHPPPAQASFAAKGPHVLAACCRGLRRQTSPAATNSHAQESLGVSHLRLRLHRWQLVFFNPHSVFDFSFPKTQTKCQRLDLLVCSETSFCFKST